MVSLLLVINLRWQIAVRSFLSLSIIVLDMKARMETAATNTSQNVIEAAALKLQQTVAADAFRGIHLDPKAHHWDEV